VIGEVIGSYRIAGLLGKGGMGEVYLAEHPVIGQRVAVKVLLPKYSDNAEVVARFFQEARAAAMVKNPGIVRVFDVGRHASSGRAYIVMEYIEGEVLARRIQRLGRLTEGAALRVARQVASALAAAHERGIVHRDLKPDNIFIVGDAEVTGGERVKVVDFGVAKLAAQANSSVRTRTGHFVGSPAYMAPEQCRGGAQIDGRADVYALACMVLEMLSGRAPYHGMAMPDVVAQKLYGASPQPRTLAPEVSAALEAVLTRALAHDPAARTPSMRALALELDEAAGIRRSPPAALTPYALDPPAITSPTPTPAAGELGPPPRGSRAGWAAAAFVFLGVGIAGAVLWRSEVGTGAGHFAGGEAPSTATLSIESEPPGAAVYRAADGVRLGTTPLARVYPRGDGQLELVLKLDGHDDAHVSLPTDRDARVTVRLTASAPGPR
jgi:serine/threonine-protein kinase